MSEDRYAHQFDIGDVVWVIRGDQPHRQFCSCPSCDGRGCFPIETVQHGRVSCPDCHGRGRVWLDTAVRFYTLAERTIGQVRVSVTTATPYRSDNAVEVGPGQWRTVEYMAHESGVGSGSVYYENTCFPTEEDARAHAETQGWVTEAVAKSPVPVAHENEDA